MSEQDNITQATNALMNEVALRTVVIGIGNAGSQIARAALAKGFNAFIMNTSKKDLADAVVGTDLQAILIGDGRGSGMSRQVSQAMFTGQGNEEIRAIFTNPYFTENVEPADIVFVTFSTGGGTGSGVGPVMTDYLRRAYPTKVIIPFAILPKMAESDTAHSNSIACVQEIAAIGAEVDPKTGLSIGKGTLSYMLADLAFYENLPQDESFKKIADYMVNCMRVIRGDFLKMSDAGMVDERDMLTVISEPGYMTINMKTGLTESMLNEKSLQGYIIDEMKASPAVRVQRDKLIQYSLVIANVNDSVQDATKLGNFSELNQFVGIPRATFKNYSVDEKVSEFEIYVINSGLTIPLDRTTAAAADVASRAESRNKQSALNLNEAVKATAIGGNKATLGIIMGSGQAKKADLSFLN